MKARRDSETRPDDTAKSLGMLYTGYLDKRNPVNGSYHIRFVVLTHDFVHWFKRSNEGVELFGEERGHIGLESILSVRVIDEDSTCFELQSTDHVKRYFRGTSPLICEEWVSAIRSAIKGFLDKDSRPTEGFESGVEVFVNLVTLKSKADDTELVISRNPAWDRIVNLSVKRGDGLLLSTTNGGTVALSYEQIELKAEDGIDFEAPVQNVPLASCLRLSVRHCVPLDSKGSQSYSNTPSNGNKFSKGIGRILSFLSIVSKHQSNSMTLVLSVMVLLVAAASAPFVSPDTSLLFVFAAVLSCHCIKRLFYDLSQESEEGDRKGLLVSLVIHGHTFTSPDAPISQPDDEIPKRFVDGCEGDLKEARRRWDITRRWRETEGVNNVFQTKQPYFSIIKSMYPFYHAGRGREGHIVFYERPGDLESAQLTARGVLIDDLLKHWIFVTEYQWQVLAGGDEAAKGIAVIDVGTVRMGDLAGDNLEYVRKTIGYANAHYPERSYVIYVVNAPIWFSLLWRIVKPLVHPNTQNKVRILTRSETLKGLQEHIDITNIPEFYGGQLDFGGHDSCRYHSPEVVELNNFVQRCNEGVVQPVNQFDLAHEKQSESVENAPPGVPGEYYTNHAIQRLDSGGSHSSDNSHTEGLEISKKNINRGPVNIPSARPKSGRERTSFGEGSLFSSSNSVPLRASNLPSNQSTSPKNRNATGNGDRGGGDRGDRDGRDTSPSREGNQSPRMAENLTPRGGNIGAGGIGGLPPKGGMSPRLGGVGGNGVGGGNGGGGGGVGGNVGMGASNISGNSNNSSSVGSGQGEWRNNTPYTPSLPPMSPLTVDETPREKAERLGRRYKASNSSIFPGNK